MPARSWLQEFGVCILAVVLAVIVVAALAVLVLPGP